MVIGLCGDSSIKKKLKSKLWQNQLKHEQKKANFVSFLIKCDLDLDFPKVTADSMPYFLNLCFLYNISQDFKTNIKAILHQTLGKSTKTGKKMPI